MTQQASTLRLSSSAHVALARATWPLLLIATAALALGWLIVTKTEGRDSLAATASLQSSQAADLTTTLTRSGSASDGVQADVVLATPTFFQLTNRSQDGAALGADRAVIFVANENVHYGALSNRFSPVLRLDGDPVVRPI
jgi:hypothetical protein